MNAADFDPANEELIIAKPRKEIVFIEDNIADYQTIAANAGAGREVVILDSTRDGLQQIADAIKGLTGIDAVHVVTHGSEGRIGLGTLTLDQTTAAQHKDVLAAIGHSMSADGDLLFYGCSVGAGQGADLIGQLAIATGADVAASDNLTGDAALGGDWDLEVRSGDVEAATFVGPALAAQYHALLGITGPMTLNFSSAPHAGYSGGGSTDLAYTIPGFSSYTLNFNGHKEDVWNYTVANPTGAYLSFSPNSTEDRITIGFTGGQTFSVNSLKVNGNSSSPQTLVFTGLRADNTEVTHANVDIPVGATIQDFVTRALSGFTDITTLVITAQGGAPIRYFQMDDLVLGSVGDTTPPTLVITSSKTTLIAGDTALITFTFSEDPGSSFTWNGSTGDVSVTGGTLSAITGSGYTRFATFTPTANTNSGTGSISVGIGKYNDAAGNNNTTISSGPAITYDTLAPNAPSAPDLSAGSDSGSSNTDNITTQKTGLVFSGTTEAGVVSVKLYESDGVTEIASTNTISGTSYTITTTGTLADGVHGVKVKAFDAAGNVSLASGSLNVTVDTAAPNAPSAPDLSAGSDSGSSSTDNITNQNTGLVFTGNTEAGVTSLKLYDTDGVTEIASTSTISGTSYTITTTGTLADGVHGVKVKAFDAAGNVSAASGSLNVTVDTAAPNAPSSPVLATNDDSGSSNSDGVTNNTTLHLSGSADAGTTVKLYDGATQIASIAASGGTYSFTLSNVAQGNHTYAAIAFDAAGNASAASAGQVVVVDTTPPSTTVTGAALSADTGASATDMVTREAVQTISGTLGTNLAAGEQVMVSLDNGATWTQASASTGSDTWQLAAVTLSGSNTLKVQVVDQVGNGGTVYSHAYTVDTVAPAASSMPDLDAASDSGSSNTDNITSVTLPSFSGTAEVGATVRLYDGGIELGSVVAVDGTWHIPTTSANEMTQRIHYITAEVVDLAGNHSATSPVLELDVRTSGPATTVAGMALSVDSGTPGDFVTNQAIQTVSGTLSGNLAAGERVEVSTNGGSTWSSATGAVGSNAWSIVAVLAGGTHDIKVRVVDALDNVGPVYTQAYTVDSVKPGVFITSSASTLKMGETATITFSFSEDPGTSFDDSDITVSGGTLSALGGSGTTRTAIFMPNAGVNGGTASIAVEADAYQDLAGNLGTAGIPRSLTFDTLAPSAPSAPNLDAASDKGISNTDKLTNATTLVFKGSADTGATVILYDTDGATEIGRDSSGSGNWTITTSALAPIAHTVTARAVDAAGNVSAVSAPATVTIDTTAPTLAITSDVPQLKIGETATITFTFSEDPGTTFTQADITVNGGTLSAIAGTGTVRTAVFTPSADTNGGAAGIIVAGGSYIDAAGNGGGAGTTPALSFDTRAPDAPSTPDLDAASDSGTLDNDDITGVTMPTFTGTAEVGATVRLYDGGTEIGSIVATDGTWAIASNRTLAEGSHSITATATDSAGNTGAASAVRTVQILTSGPATTVAGLQFSADTGVSNHDFVTAIASQTVSGTLSANLATGERVQVSLDGGGNWTTASASVGSKAWSLPATLASGTHTLQVRVIDALGNIGPVLSQDYTLDSVAPGLTITSDAAQLKIGQTATITFTFSEDPGTSFSQGDITVNGGSLSAIAGTGLVRTATFTPSADTNGGTASISVAAGSYADKAGNDGTAGAAPSLTFDTLAPSAPSAPDLDAATDKGTSNTDKLTNETKLVYKGSAEAGATVILYDTDGATEIGRDSSGSGAWTITTTALAAGAHSVTARAVDAAGNVSAVSAPATVTIDTTAPTMEIVRGASQLKAGETTTVTFVFSEDPGTSFGLDDITVTNGSVSGLLGTGLTRTVTFTPAPGVDGGVATIAAEGYTDAAGNAGGKGAAVSIGVDTVAPPAPGAPVLKADSDSGILGDGITKFANVVIEGTALANALVTLYDGTATQSIGSVRADASGKWSIALANLGVGTHALSTTQSDAAGNVSARGAVFDLRIDRPAEPASLIDGMPVQIQPVLLPGGAVGTAVSVPVVTSDRAESSGKAGVADIPLLSSGGSDLLVAQLAPGYGLSASGANVPAANAAAHLIGAILAATSGHAAGDQGHLTDNGQSFLNGLAASGSLLVETVAPVSSTAPDGVLTLSGAAAPAGQDVALVI